jgi:DNA modification methylase
MNTKVLSKLELTYRKISELSENARNPRTHSEKQIKKLVKSISEFGLNVPIVIDKDDTIISGNAVFKAAKRLGLAEVPTVMIDHLTKAQKKAFIIAVNKIAEDAGWDNIILKEDFEILIQENFDLTFTGFEIGEIDVIMLDLDDEGLGEDAPEDEVPDESEIPERTKSGDLYQLGKHKMVCGDSLKDSTLKVLLGLKKAQMVFADPPYNVKVNGHVCENGKHPEFAMASGEMKPAEFTNFLRTSMKNLVNYTTDGSIHFLCMDWKHSKEILDAADGVYAELKNICAWDKGTGGMGSLYRSQHEFIFVFKNGKASHINNIQLGKHGRYRTNVWQYPGVRASNPDSLEDLKLHPTVKNLAMVADAILDCSNPNDIILDTFAGSGTTLLAAEKTNRTAYVVEYEPHYCDIILHRWEKLTGKTAELLGNYGELNND